MARVKIEGILDKLSSEMKRALQDALDNVGADDVDHDELFRAFARAVGRKCSTWETVSDRFVQTRCPSCGTSH